MHDSFLHNVREKSEAAKKFGKAVAIRHVKSLASVDDSVAEAFYEDVKKELGAKKIVALNLFPEDVLEFVSTGKLTQTYSERRLQIEKAAGTNGPVVFAVLSKALKGNTEVGPCSIILGGVENEAVVVSGDAGRLRNASRLDYAPNPSDVLYDWADADDAMASSAILALGPHEMSGGLYQAMEHIRDDMKVYGPCHVMLAGKITPQNIKSIVVPDEKLASEVKARLDAIKRLAPIEIDASKIYMRMPFLEREEKDVPQLERDYQPVWVSVGEKVALKPMASNPMALGRVIDVANGKVSVEWSAGDRTIFGLQEALARLMPAPDEEPMDDVKSYSVPGMTKEASSKLISLGVDPVDLYSVVFTMTPPRGSNVEEKNLTEAMSNLGVDGEFVDGFAENEDSVYVPKRWFEANLPFGNRLIVDASNGKPKIAVGIAPEYVLLPEFTDVFAE